MLQPINTNQRSSYCPKIQNSEYLALCGRYWQPSLIQDIIRDITLYGLLGYFLSRQNEVITIVSIVLLSIHALVCIIFGLALLCAAILDGVKRTKRIYHQNPCQAVYKCMWLVIIRPLLFLVCPIFIIMAFTASAFRWFCVGPNSDCSVRFLENADDYTRAILHYTINHASKQEIKRRIIACDYCLIAALSPQIEKYKESGSIYREPELLINFIANKHNNNIGKGIANMTWMDLISDKRKNVYRDFYEYGDDGSSSDIVILLFACFILIDMGFVITAMVAGYHDLSLGMIITCCIYIIVEVICAIIYLKMTRLMFYTFHVLPYVMNIKELKMEDQFGDVATMMDDIEMIYQIMFNSSQEIEAVMDKDNDMPADVATIICEYLWFELPLYQKGGNDFETLGIWD